MKETVVWSVNYSLWMGRNLIPAFWSCINSYAKVCGSYTLSFLLFLTRNHGRLKQQDAWDVSKVYSYFMASSTLWTARRNFVMSYVRRPILRERKTYFLRLLVIYRKTSLLTTLSSKLGQGKFTSWNIWASSTHFHLCYYKVDIFKFVFFVESMD